MKSPRQVMRQIMGYLNIQPLVYSYLRNGNTLLTFSLRKPQPFLGCTYNTLQPNVEAKSWVKLSGQLAVFLDFFKRHLLSLAPLAWNLACKKIGHTFPKMFCMTCSFHSSSSSSSDSSFLCFFLSWFIPKEKASLSSSLKQSKQKKFLEKKKFQQNPGRIFLCSGSWYMFCAHCFGLLKGIKQMLHCSGDLNNQLVWYSNGPN